MVTASLSPQCGGVRGPWFSNGCDDSFAAQQKLAHKFEPDASARTEYEPGGGFAISVEDIGDLIHAGMARETGAVPTPVVLRSTGTQYLGTRAAEVTRRGTKLEAGATRAKPDCPEAVVGIVSGRVLLAE